MITGANEFSIIRHDVSTLRHHTIFSQRSIESFQVPPDISVEVRLRETIMNFLSGSQYVSPCYFSIKVLSHPDFFSFAFSQRVFPESIAIDVSTNNINIRSGFSIIQEWIRYRMVKIK